MAVVIKDWSSNYPTELDDTSSSKMPNLSDDIGSQFLSRVSQIHAVRNAVIAIEAEIGSDGYETDSLRYKIEHAIRDDIRVQIGSITEKGTPISADIILIEDSADLYRKKRVQIGNLPGGSGNTLDQAYDQGGSGAGRQITADSGAVFIDASEDCGLDLDGYISLRELLSEPSPLINRALIYSQDDGGVSKVYVKWSDNTIIEIGSSGISFSDIDGYAEKSWVRDGYTDLTTFNDHSARHESGGADSIKLDDLASPDDNTDLNTSVGAHGLCPKLDNDTSHYLRGDGSWTTPDRNTLDQAYDQGGAGIGRQITADSGAVIIDASGDNALDLDGYLFLGELASSPTAVSNKGGIYTAEVDGNTELYYIDDGGSITQITSDGYLNTFESLIGVGLFSQSSDPVSSLQKGFVYSKVVGANTELFYKDDHNRVLQLTNNGGLSIPEGFTRRVEVADELITTTGNETQLPLTGEPIVQTGTDSGYALDVFQNGIRMKFVESLGTDNTEWTYDEILNTVEFVHSGEVGTWYLAEYATSGLVDGYVVLESMADPDPLPGAGLLYSKQIDGYTELFYMDNYGTSTQITSDGYLNTYESLRGVGLFSQESDPTQAVDKGYVYTKLSDGYTELHYMDDYGVSTQITDKGSVNGSGGGTGGGWETIVDLDFSTQANQTLSSDTTYSIGGYTWTKINSANEAAAMAVVNGSGLVIQPASASDHYTTVRTLPAITCPLTSLITGVDLSTRIRIMVYISAGNWAANYDFTDICLENPTVNTFFALRKLFYNTGIVLNAVHILNGSASGDVKNGNISSSDVLQLDVLTGLAALSSIWAHGSYSGGLPTQASLIPFAYREATGATVHDLYSGANTKIGVIGDWNLLIGAARAGSGTSLSTTISRIKIEVKY